MSDASEFFAYQNGREPNKRRCVVCSCPEAKGAVHDVLAEAAKSGRTVRMIALGEWVVRTFDVDFQPRSIEHHLKAHESELWDEVRG